MANAYREMNKATGSAWIATTPATTFPGFSGRDEVDVVVVGAGIAGLTAALLLKNAGKSVVVLERDRIAIGESGKTTAHLTEVIDTRYHRLISDFGLEGARLACAASREAIDLIASLAERYQITCGFERVPAYLYDEWGKDQEMLRKEFDALRQVGIQSEWVTEVPLPFSVEYGLYVPNQAQIHPREYLLGLSKQIPSESCAIFEQTIVRDIKDGEPCRVVTDNGEILAKDVLVTTNSPMASRVFPHTKVHSYRTYALAVKLKRGKVPYGLYWDTEDPYHYTRLHRLKGPGLNPPSEVLIVGGEDHRVGMKSEEESFESLLEYVHSRYSVDSVLYQWSGQIMEPVDGLPYIGQNALSDHIWVATGFAGNGMTFGTISGRILSDLVLGVESPYAKLFEAIRIKPLSSLGAFLHENKDFPLCFVADRLRGAEANTLDEVQPGEGKILSVNGEKVAVYKGYDGQVDAVSPVCTHMGCHVHWNGAEKSWDCPCHGSRFSTKGAVINSPATTPLKPVAIDQLLEEPLRKVSGED